MACGGTGAGRSGQAQAPIDTVALAGGQVLTDTVQLAQPQTLLLSDSTLVVQDGKAAFALKAFSTGGRALGATGRDGAGPGEFVDPQGAFPRPGHPGEVWVYDARLNRITPYDVAALRGGGPVAPRREAIVLNPALVVERPAWLDDSTLVALSPMLQPGDRRFALFGPDGRQRGSVGEPPPEGIGGPAFVRQQAYGGRIAVHPRQPWFVLAGMFAGRLEVYDRAGMLRRSLRVPRPYEPDYHVARDGMNMLWGDRFRYGYVDVAATDRSIYGLFSGVQFEQDGAELGREVHVFDWEGRLLRVMRVDRPAAGLAVDAAETRLYLLRQDPFPQIVRYDLPRPSAQLTQR